MSGKTKEPIINYILYVKKYKCIDSGANVSVQQETSIVSLKSAGGRLPNTEHCPNRIDALVMYLAVDNIVW